MAGGEIDRLEIQIAADASEAANRIKSLADSLTLISKNAGNAVEGLNSIAESFKNFKGFKTANISKAIDNISDAFSRIGKIGELENTVELLDAVENIETATNGLRRITENVSALKVNKSFETNLDNLKAALTRLNDMGDTSRFAGGVESIAQSIERLNNIEVGNGFFNLVSATTQWSDALDRLNGARLGSEFSQGIARVARAAEILNDVDFSGFKRMNDMLAKLPDNVRVSFGASSSEVQELSESLAQLQSTISSINAGVTSLATKRTRKTVDTGDIKASEDIEKIGEASEESLSRLDASGQKMADILAGIASKTKEAVPVVVDGIEKISLAFASISTTAAGTAIKAIFAPLTKLGDKFKEASIKAGQFLASIKRIAMYRAIRSAIKAVTEGFAEGRKNLYYYSQAVGTDFAPSMDKAATAALYLKNSIGAATAPLTNMLVPMIDKAVDHIVELINKFNELTAVLTKQSTWTKAIKFPTTWQDALDDANKSAKKLKSTMLGFDELNVIEQTAAGVKAKAFDMEDYSRMFKEMQTSNIWKDKIPELFMPVKLAWDAEGDNTLRAIKNTWNEILALLGAVGDSFRKVWMNGTGQKTLELILQITQEIVGTFGSLAKKIREAWQENDKGTKIIQSVWNVANNLLTVFRDIWSSIHSWAEGLDWNPLLDSIGKLTDAFDKLTNPDGGAMTLLKGLFTDVLEPLGKWTIEEAAPVAVSLLASAVNFLGTALDKIEPVAKRFYDNFLKPIAEWTGTRIIDDMKEAKTLLDDLTKLMNGDKSFFEKHMPFANDLFSDKNEKGKKITSAFSNLKDRIEEDPKKAIEKALHIWNPFMFRKSTFSLIDWFDSKFSDSQEDNSAEYSKTLLKADYKNQTTLSEKPKYNADIAGLTEIPVYGEEEAESIQKATEDIKALSAAIDTAGEKSGFFKDFGANFKDGTDQIAEAFDKLKTKLSTGWDNIKKSLSSGWDTLKGKVSDFAASWDDKFSGIGEKAFDTWESVKGWLGDNLSWEALSGKVSTFADNFSSKFEELKNNTGAKFGEIKKTINGMFDDIGIYSKAAKFRDDLLDIFGGILGHDENSGIRGKLNGVKNTFTSVFNKISDAVREPFNSIIDSVESAVNLAIWGINELLNRLDDLSVEVPSGLRDAASKLGINMPKEYGFSINMRFDPVHIPRLASGGMVDDGQLFIARESGAELVGQYGGNTAVMNNQQIVKAVTDGVYKAVTMAMSQAPEKQIVVNSPIYLDRKELTAQVQQQEQSNGASIFSDVVYT